jgi:SAM-dependent methyltransferase
VSPNQIKPENAPSGGDVRGAIHPAARVGFGAAADAYERGRPEYPTGAVGWLVETLAIGPGARVLDLAAGTGKLTRMLVGGGGRLVAVEPVDGMRRVFRSVLPDVPVVGGRAEAIPLADRSIDAAVVAQAFHWFDAPAAIRELHRVLRPGGRLGLVWNVRDEGSSAFWAGLTELLAPHRGDVPAHRGSVWRRAFESSDLFAPLETRSFPFEQALTRQQVLDRVLSTSFVATLAPSDRDAVADGVLALLEEDPNTAGRDVVRLPYRTDVHTTVRAG